MLTLAFDNGLIPVIAIVGGVAVAIIAIVFGNVASMVQTRNREETKRELAAYVAEGSITPDDAERILKSDAPKNGGCC